MQKEEWDAEKSEQVKKNEWETVNQANALWTRSKSDITDEHYQEFYKHIGHDYDDPLAWTHHRVEGRSDYTQLLYLPTHAPMALWDSAGRSGVRPDVSGEYLLDQSYHLLS